MLSHPQRGSLASLMLAASACFAPTGGASTTSATATDPTTSSSSGPAATSTTATGDDATTVSSSVSVGSTSSSGAVDACGDGVLAAEEECDDGNVDPGDGCSPGCTKEFRRVFVTSALFSGDLGGVDGADDKCQAAARAAQLPGMFRAWLSTDASSPESTFIRSEVPYVLVDGEVVASGWDDLVDENLATGIFMTEWGDPPAENPGPCGDFRRLVWTNTSAFGTHAQLDRDCSAWSSSMGGLGRNGTAGEKDFTWTASCEADCGLSFALYCFEQ